MIFFAVTGNPILFSLSPVIFNSFFEKNKIDAKYIRLAAESAKEAIDLFKELGLSGMNVTAPFKTDIIQYLDHVDKIATDIGSVNTVVNENGKLCGYNTDYYGIVDTLKNINNKKILLLGAGGAAKAVVYSILQKNGKITIYNRTEEKAKSLANNYDVNYCKKQDLQKIVEQSDIIINTLPSGIKILEDDWLKPEQVLFDAIYHRPVYKQIANKLGMKFYSGEDWLINQAIPAYKLFINEGTPLFERPNLELKKPNDKIIFSGFMGTGKSAIGEHIAEILNCKFLSTDNIISNKEQSSINDIFEKHGEAYFRKVEYDVLKMLSTMEGKAIISSGGGMVLDEKNRKLITESYLSICLYASPETIMERVSPENRPILKDNFNIEFVRELMDKRKEFYLQTADVLINTSGKSIEEVIKIVLREISTIN